MEKNRDLTEGLGFSPRRENLAFPARCVGGGNKSKTQKLGIVSCEKQTVGYGTHTGGYGTELQRLIVANKGR